MSAPVKRLAVYSIQARDPDWKYLWAWGVSHAPIPERMPFHPLDFFKTHAEAMYFAQRQVAPAASEVP